MPKLRTPTRWVRWTCRSSAAARAGEEFEVHRRAGRSRLLEQVGNYELVNDDLDSLTIPELEKYAADRDIDLTGLTKKPAIISAIKKG
jgi:hypothetical protein